MLEIIYLIQIRQFVLNELIRIVVLQIDYMFEYNEMKHQLVYIIQLIIIMLIFENIYVTNAQCAR